MPQPVFPDLTGTEPTIRTLHAYSKVLGVIPRVHAPVQDHWWHISLKVSNTQLHTGEIPLPDGGSLILALDLARHAAVLSVDGAERGAWELTAGDTADQLAGKIFSAVADLGLPADYPQAKYSSPGAPEYDRAQAETFFSALWQIDVLFKQHKGTLTGSLSPVQLWPHGFDISVEWFGTRSVDYEENGKVTSYPSQLNLGFSPGESSHAAPYFYSNPFPFEAEKLLFHELPNDARWFTESWKGTLLEYAPLAGDPDGHRKVLEYAAAVFEIASPILTR